MHRDVKPANVMVTDEGGIKIMDFGIARVLGAEQKTVDFRLMGTPAYMSPEQVMGEEVDGRSDLYSVGVLFYRLISGALPFTADTALGHAAAADSRHADAGHVHRPSLPAWCDADRPARARQDARRSLPVRGGIPRRAQPRDRSAVPRPTTRGRLRLPTASTASPRCSARPTRSISRGRLS